MTSTLRDVAKLANVSTATVSRVVNNTGYVRESTKKRVADAIRHLNYQPNGIARSLKSSNTKMIGVIVPDISNPYFMEMIRAIENVVSPEYHMLMSSSNDSSAKEHDYVNVFLEKRVEALVVAPSSMNMGMFVDEFVRREIPLVFIDRYANDVNVDTVVENCRHSSSQIVKSLISRGHNDIAIIWTSGVSTGHERLQGYEEALTSNGIKIHSNYVCEGQYTEHAGYDATVRLLGLRHPPTAIFATNNRIAVGVLTALRERKIQVPEEMSVVSFGDLPQSQLISPLLTAVIQRPQYIGEKAAELLIQRIRGHRGPARRVVLEASIREGCSIRQMN